MHRLARSLLQVGLFVGAPLSMIVACELTTSDDWPGNESRGQGGAHTAGGSGAGLPFGTGSTGGAGSACDGKCGGGCPPCADGKACSSPDDCKNKVCEASICQAATCSDNVKNGSEVEADCGGSCPGCDNGHACTLPKACASGNCVDGVCCESACDESCMACDQQGQCANVPAYVDDLDASNACTLNVTCDGQGKCLIDIFGACNSNDTCASHFCLAFGSSPGICSKKTGDACASHEECASSNCVQDHCAECQVHHDCGSDRVCVVQRCYQACDANTPCNPGDTCTDAIGFKFCLPDCDESTKACAAGQKCVNKFCVPDAP